LFVPDSSSHSSGRVRVSRVPLSDTAASCLSEAAAGVVGRA
jgi:hypothetical protein